MNFFHQIIQEGTDILKKGKDKGHPKKVESSTYVLGTH